MIVSAVPTGGRSTVNNERIFKSTANTFGNYLVSSKQNPGDLYSDIGYGLHVSDTPQHIDFVLDTSAATDFGGATDTGTGSSSGFVIYTSAGFAETSVN